MATGIKARKLALVVAVATLPGTLFAMDIAAAFRDALTNDAIVASARSQLEAIRERVPQARAGLLPGINGTASINRWTSDNNVSARRDYTAQNYGIQLSQPLLRLQNVETFEQSKLAVLIAEAQYEAARQDLMVRVSQAYFDVLIAQDNMETLVSQKRAISEQLAAAKRNFEVGTATITDQQEAQARFDLVLAQEVVARNDIETKRAALSLLIGKPVPSLHVVRTDATIEAPKSSQGEWTDVARNNNLGVVQAKVAGEIARREIEKQRYGHYPTVDAVASLGHNRSASALFIGVNTTAASVGLQMTVPLYTSGAIDAKVREAISARNKAESDLENARRQAEQAARSYYLGSSSGIAQVGALKAAEKSSQLALDSNLLGYQVGVRINIDVLNAQQQLFTTRRDLAKARYDVLLNGLRLKAVAGELDVKDLERVSALMQPASSRPADASTVKK